MKTTDFTLKISSDQLNESMFKKFGKRINFDKYTREELENYRNILRTQVHQEELDTKFNDLLSNENYQQTKFMLNVLNTKIKEMLGEAKLPMTTVNGKKVPAFAADGKGKNDISKKKKKTEETTMNKTTTEAKKTDRTGDGKKNFDDVQAARYQAGGMPKKKAIAKATSDNFKEGFPTVDDAKKASQGTAGMKKGETKKSSTGGTITRVDDKTIRHTAGKNYGGSEAPKTPDSDKKEKVKKIKESIFKARVQLVNESLWSLLQEDEEGKAKAITASSDMVNDFTTWMTRIGQYQTKSMIELADSIRSEFGQAESDAFKQSVAPALSATLEVLTQQREAISQAVAQLAGEAPPEEPMGMEPEMGLDSPEMEPADTDTMNEPTDGFETDDAAAGGAEVAGREMRENRQVRKFNQIAESHSIISRLAR